MSEMEMKKGKPAICIPLTGRTREELAAELELIKNQPHQMVEWRADFLMAANKGESFWNMTREVLNTLGFLKAELDVPVLFTIRTSGEGGEADITAEDYIFVNKMVADGGMADFVDIEAFAAEGTDLVSEFVAYAHEKGQKILLSNHDFEKTPPVEEMAGKYDYMNDLGGDIIKLAVMPQNEDDVTALLEAAAVTSERYPGKPVVAISMGELGMASRVCAGQFGSVITFASGKTASAPGQIDAKTLNGYLERYYK